jgi:hypothetical protein
MTGLRAVPTFKSPQETHPGVDRAQNLDDIFPGHKSAPEEYAWCRSAHLAVGCEWPCPAPFLADRRNALLKHLVSPRSAPVANLQHETAATNARRGGSYCAYSRLARHERRSTRPAPPLCKQGVRGSSPLGSTPSQSGFALAWWLYFLVRTAESTATGPPANFLVG